MKRLASAFANRLQAKAAIRRKRFIKRSVEKMHRGEMLAGEWFGEPLDLHIVPPAGRRDPRGPDGRPLW